MKKQIAPYAMPIVYALTAVVLIVGFLKIIAWALGAEAWNKFWDGI